MKITSEEVVHVARLARLKLEPVEIVRFQRELSSILAYMDMLKEVETADIEPTFHVHSLANALRDDLVQQSQPREEALVNAPKINKDFFEVPRVIE